MLDHRAEHVDLSWARDGMPLLVNHSSGELVGLIENVRVDGDRRLRGDLKWSQSAKAREARQDVDDGIRRKMSVGYALGAMLERRAADDSPDGMEIRRYAWTPMEGSLVAIPADYTVGVGRTWSAGMTTTTGTSDTSLAGDAGAASDESIPGTEPARGAEGEDMADKANTPPDRDESERVGNVGEVPAEAAYRARTERLANIAKANDMTDRLPGWLSGTKSVQEIQDEILATYRERQAQVTPAGHVDLSPKEQRAYSLSRAIRAAAYDKTGSWSEAGLEKEASETIRARLNRDSVGFFVPMNLAVRTAVTGNIAATASLGGNVVQTSVLSLIELLRNKMMVRSLGATVLSGLRDNVAFPRQITANTLTWTGENPATANANTAATLDQVTLSPKTAMASTAYSRQLLVQSTIDVDNFISNDLALVNAIGLDLAAIAGTGASNQPTGILTAASGATVKALGTNGAVPTFADFVDLETQQATNNADIGTLAMLTTPQIRGLMKVTERATNTGLFVWGADNTVNGYRAEVSNQVPSNLTKGTATTVCHGIIFGNWSELLIGEFGGAMEILVDPYTVAGQNMVQVHSFLMADIALRHGASFTVIKDARLS